ncbi:MAG: serine/threonine-protein phosphatase [Deltaproteobacteria bacterium]|jgi:hypothetical protein|nr:serine/threonine-protein phosphatase [Deltaproteobacteria bacterium]
MKFIANIVSQRIKTGQIVSGDYFVSHRSSLGTLFLLCDGIGSGVYANIAATLCAARLLEMFKLGISLRAASETVASGMNRARTEEDIPFAAFSAALFTSDGQYNVYGYESPPPIIIQDEKAKVISPRFFAAGFEMIGESVGTLRLGDSMILNSDGVTQAGLGHGYGDGDGVGPEGIAEFINRRLLPKEPKELLPSKITDMCASLADFKFDDDATLMLLRCQEARELTVLTGPPIKKAWDSDYAKALFKFPGKKIICGSTTASLVSRELGLKVKTVNTGENLGLPPEYAIDGVDLVAEGAVTLSQVYNVLEEPLEKFEESVVKRFCKLLREADVIHFFIGTAVNEAHESLLFKQLGVRVRKNTLRKLCVQLRRMGKLVTENYF